MNSKTSLERRLEILEARHFRADDRYWDKLDAIEKREQKAVSQIGELVRDGKTVHYVSPQGGRYREGTVKELLAFLIRNNYA